MGRGTGWEGLPAWQPAGQYQVPDMATCCTMHGGDCGVHAWVVATTGHSQIRLGAPGPQSGGGVDEVDDAVAAARNRAHLSQPMLQRRRWQQQSSQHAAGMHPSGQRGQQHSLGGLAEGGAAARHSSTTH